jgi:hypothetical protein
MADKYGVEDFEVIVEVLWKKYQEISSYGEGEVYEDFDSPYYWGLPRRIANKIRGDAVDIIQGELEMLFSYPRSKAQFRKSLRESLFILASM